MARSLQNGRASVDPMIYIRDVDSTRSIRNVALIGFMGSGKTSVGRALAELLGFEFLDTDEMIETRVQKPITQIFEQNGEAFFRSMEESVVTELGDRSGVVISTGGGLPAHQPSLDHLKTHALVVCLWASPERIFERVRHQTHRPLLNVPDPLARIRELVEVRTPFYRQADVLVSAEGRPVREIAQHVAAQFQLARQQHP